MSLNPAEDKVRHVARGPHHFCIYIFNFNTLLIDLRISGCRPVDHVCWELQLYSAGFHV